LNTEKSKFVKHIPCDTCGSSDGNSLYTDGHTYCFVCTADSRKKKKENFSESSKVSTLATDKNTFLHSYKGSYNALDDRKISLKTAKAFGVLSSPNRHVYPYFNNNEVAATKTREIDTKKFFSNGNFEGTGLFGEQLYRNTGGKYLTITEGECDAMAVYEMFGGKWAVVSVRGAMSAVKDIRESIEFVEAYDNIVLSFDNDVVGQKAARKVARILKPNKTKIMSFPTGFKDANDMLKQGKYEEFTKAWWESKTYTPSGIIELYSKKKEWLKREDKKSVPYPWKGLNKKLYGMRKGELVTITGGTGLGKSSVTRELEHWLIKNTTDNVGIVALEEKWIHTADCLISIEANDRIYLDEKRKNYSEEHLEKLFDNVIEKGRVFIHAHLGGTDIDEVFSKLRYIIVGCKCEWIVLDHVHMLINVMTEKDERRGIDHLMTRLRSLVEETGIGLILVCHLRRAAGEKGHEQGIEVSLSHLKGSQGISQLSDCVIALERNQQADDPEEANTTRVRVLKSRYTGDTGLACSLKYNSNTGRLYETDLDLSPKQDSSLPF
jgi:twinkle protein